MTPPRKKLIEVALPLKAINEASAREKSIRHGHPSTLHLWWARRPLAACRAVLFASFVDDPESDPDLRREYRALGEEKYQEAVGRKRAALFNLIEELVQWENSNNPEVIRSARAEIARCVASRLVETGQLASDRVIAEGVTVGDLVTRCHCRPINAEFDKKAERIRYRFETLRLPPAAVVDKFLSEHSPPVLDPFCGGGTIPLEAQRLGLRAYGSDLNPVAVLMTKALIEIPPKFAGCPPVNPDWQQKSREEKAAMVWHGAQGLADDVRYYGNWMRQEAEKRIGHLYPKLKITAEILKTRPDLKEWAGQELSVIAWLWARTVVSPNPAFQGVDVPLVRSFWLSKKIGQQTWVEPIVDKSKKTYRFAIRVGVPSAEQKKSIDTGTKIGRGCKFRCLLSGEPIPESHVKSEGMHGRLRVRLMAVVAETGSHRVYLNPQDDYEQIATRIAIPPASLHGVDVPIALDKRAIWCLLYGIDQFDKLFTNRQLKALITFSDLVHELRNNVQTHAQHAGLPMDDRLISDDGVGPNAYAGAISTYLGEAVSKTAAFHCTLAAWRAKEGKSARGFGRQAIPMVWDFAEVNPFAAAGGALSELVDAAAKTISRLPASAKGIALQQDAAKGSIIDNAMISTDPPYYDNVG